MTIAPGLSRSARVVRASTSAGLFRNDTGESLPGSNGLHIYVLLQDGGDAARFLQYLHDRCWLCDLGWHVIGGAGQLLERSQIDRMVGYGERLCFEGAPLIVPPLKQDPAKRIPRAFDGEAINSRLAAPRLTEYERYRVNQAKVESRDALTKAAQAVRPQHDKMLAEAISAKFGMPSATAQRFVSARHRGVLLPCMELDFDHIGMVPVAAVLSKPDDFVGETLADPLEGASYGRSKAKLMRRGDGTLFIHSFAHGRAFYQLRHDARSAMNAISKAPVEAVVEHAMAILANADLNDHELEQFAEKVAEIGKVKVRFVKDRIKKQRKEKEAADRQAKMAANAKGRIIRPRPEPDGELRQIVEFLDELLASDRQEVPPMRDASGRLVEVRVREPWNLHQVTVAGANACVEDGENIKAPAEPALVQLTPVRIELLLENYVRWTGDKKGATYFGALPRPYIDALNEYSPSSIPIARAINTAPLVSISGSIIDGVGLDRNSGLFHQIDPLLHACLPSNRPSEREVLEALHFLLDVWLIDVALDEVGKCIVLLLALTLIERALLAERPAFFVTAGQRGGGKTTLLLMITLAVLGRKAAAAAWSTKPEERKKALFSYLRQGVAFLAWDNIPRGSAISCPHIEAALTASEISDRVLGVSRVETAPAITVQAFTGNMIAPLGDMASRSLVIALKVNRPDPENRTFAHPDPLAWTEANRQKILRSLYTLLIAGALNRPQHQEPKTRFKSWWKVVGWPIEFATKLAGFAVDCAELMRAGEAEDEEASAVSAALSLFLEIWGSGAFTAKEVSDAMRSDPNGKGFLSAERERADALASVLSELAGKRLDKPTAHALGKLFQKRLVGRPAWIDGGQRFAILRKSPNHEANSYRVEVPAEWHDIPSEDFRARPGADMGKNNPDIPDFPGTTNGEDRRPGNVGKDGNVSRGFHNEVRSSDVNGGGESPIWRARI